MKLEFILLILFTCFVILICIAARVFVILKDKKRKDEIEAFAKKHRFTLYPKVKPGCLGLDFPGSLFARYVGGSVISKELTRMLEGFQPFDIGESRYINNAIIAELPFGTFYTFDYGFSTGGQRCSYGIAVFRVPFAFKKLVIRPEILGDKLAYAMGLHDIEFESVEFNREYHVHSADQKFAFDVVHPEMMAFLLALPKADWQLAGPYIVLTQDGYWLPNQLEELLLSVERFLELIPDYVRQEIAIERSWTSPF